MHKLPGLTGKAFAKSQNAHYTSIIKIRSNTRTKRTKAGIRKSYFKQSRKINF